MKKLCAGAAALAMVTAASASEVRAVTATFDLKDGVLSSSNIGQVDLSLNRNGTVAVLLLLNPDIFTSVLEFAINTPGRPTSDITGVPILLDGTI
jgi:hypothetical protein